MQKKTRIVIALAMGFIAAMAIMAVAIFSGYANAYDTGAEASPVRDLGIPVYQLAKDGSEHIGESNGPFMGLVCGICMALGVTIEEIIVRIRRKRTSTLHQGR